MEDLSKQLENALQNLTWPDSTLYVPIRYVLNLGGKRVRPLLLLLAYRAFGGKKLEQALPAALAIEFFHNFTLVHDDIMDAAPSRRGQPSVHAKFGVPMAILAGDALQILSYEYVQKAAQGPILEEILPLFNRTALEICEGQAADMLFEKKWPTLEEYFTMIRQKTAVLLSLSLRMGALLAGCNNTQSLAQLENIAINLGLLYQIQDDWLDFYGHSPAVGKQKGGDILQHKKTLLILLAAQSRAIESVEKGFQLQNPIEKIAYFEQLFEEEKISEKVQAQMALYEQRLQVELKYLAADTKILSDFIFTLTQRKQ